jgi:hypothetical protein
LQPHLAFPSPDVTGDFNRDGIVDASDYVLWRRILGQNVPPGSGADADRNGVIEQADYALWQANLGATPGGGASARSSVTIPEPPAILLAWIALICAAPSRRSHFESVRNPRATAHGLCLLQFTS